jgi:Na+/H+ antiporter NhaD/arsenite permease-like protein
MAPAALRKIDTSGVLFFFGILMSVGALDAAGILRYVAEYLDKVISGDSLLASMIGIASAVIDNVPLVVSELVFQLLYLISLNLIQFQIYNRLLRWVCIR